MHTSTQRTQVPAALNGYPCITARDVKAARASSGLTQAAAARVIYNAIDNWQNWEQGRYPMLPGLFELFLLKTGQLTLGEDFEKRQGSKSSAAANFGARIFKMRKAKNITQLALAEQVGVTKQAVCNWESGKYRAPRAPTLARVCKVFDVSLEFILDGSD